MESTNFKLLPSTLVVFNLSTGRMQSTNGRDDARNSGVGVALCCVGGLQTISHSIHHIPVLPQNLISTKLNWTFHNYLKSLHQKLLLSPPNTISIWTQICQFPASSNMSDQSRSPNIPGRRWLLFSDGPHQIFLSLLAQRNRLSVNRANLRNPSRRRCHEANSIWWKNCSLMAKENILIAQNTPLTTSQEMTEVYSLSNINLEMYFVPNTKFAFLYFYPTKWSLGAHNFNEYHSPKTRLSTDGILTLGIGFLLLMSLNIFYLDSIYRGQVFRLRLFLGIFFYEPHERYSHVGISVLYRGTLRVEKWGKGEGGRALKAWVGLR